MAESSPKWVENTMGKGEIARYERLVLQKRKTRACLESVKAIGWVFFTEINPRVADSARLDCAYVQPDLALQFQQIMVANDRKVVEI